MMNFKLLCKQKDANSVGLCPTFKNQQAEWSRCMLAFAMHVIT